MMGLSSQCYIPSHKVIGPLVLEKIFEGFLPYMGVATILGHVTQTRGTTFHFPMPLRLHMKFGFDRPSGFGEEDLWKWWMTDGGMYNGPWLYYKLTNEPKGSGELKINFLSNNFLFIISGENLKANSNWWLSYLKYCYNHIFKSTIYWHQGDINVTT